MKKEYYLYLLLSSTMLGVPVVYAACVPTPDCEELGYTATECSEGGVKCPWDTTKLFCGPSCNLTTTKADCDANCLNVGTQSCSKNGVTYYSGCGVSKCTSGQSCVNGTCTCDSVYKYTCSGTGYAGGVGTTCGAGANIQLVPVHKIMRGAAVLAYCLAIVLINILVAEQI